MIGYLYFVKYDFELYMKYYYFRARIFDAIR